MYGVCIFVENLKESIVNKMTYVVNVFMFFFLETREEEMPLIQLLTTEQLSIDTGDEDSDFEVPLAHIKNRTRNKEVDEFTATLAEIRCLKISSDSDNAMISEPQDI
ncbi:hypothetical protein PoB_002015600 [Plakobranchus ocellatus]|uniref:Uncharacterized protein n=1 Tax=Plakobranchus ocellatus TaxID=259542 RepID=A0AAV3Z2V6_9GAST|nr:hypothetical protein PoB_002015600 [Plakobranchus ocellatus]